MFSLTAVDLVKMIMGRVSNCYFQWNCGFYVLLIRVFFKRVFFLLSFQKKRCPNSPRLLWKPALGPNPSVYIPSTLWCPLLCPKGSFL